MGREKASEEVPEVGYDHTRHNLMAVTSEVHLLVTDSSINVCVGGLSGLPNLTKVSLLHIETVDRNAFMDNKNLIEVMLPNAKLIGDQAFKLCPNLTNVFIPNVTNIGARAFENCFNLRHVTCDLGTVVLHNAFTGCLSLKILAAATNFNAVDGSLPLIVDMVNIKNYLNWRCRMDSNKENVLTTHLLLKLCESDRAIPLPESKLAIFLSDKGQCVSSIILSFLFEERGKEKKDMRRASKGMFLKMGLEARIMVNSENDLYWKHWRVHIDSNDDEAELSSVAFLDYCRMGYYDVVKFLVEGKKADLDLTDSNGKSGLHWACHKNNHLLTVVYLLKKGAPVNKVDRYGQSALYLACHFGHLDLVKTLIEHGADVNQCDNKGYTPLIAACDAKRYEVVKFFLTETDVDVNMVTKLNSTTALLVSAQKGFLEAVKLLVECGRVDIDQTTSGGATAVLLANGHDRQDVVKYLVSKGACINKPLSDGVTVLMHCSGKGDLETMKFLVEHGAEVNAQAKNGRTALFIAANEGIMDVVIYLCSDEVRADVTKATTTGVTPSQAAKANGHEIIWKLLEEKEAEVVQQQHQSAVKCR